MQVEITGSAADERADGGVIRTVSLRHLRPATAASDLAAAGNFAAHGDESQDATELTRLHLPVHAALSVSPPLSVQSPERDALWLAVADAICTRSRVEVTPLGSARAVDVGGEDARSAELLAAMEWLYANEPAARALKPFPLFKKLRGVATRSARGSARQALADSLGGISHVGAGDGICWVELPVSEVA